MTETKLETLTYKEIVELATSVAVSETIKTMEEQWEAREKAKRDKRLHNTKLLLKNYRLFKLHRDSSIYKLSQLENSTAEIMSLMNTTGSNTYRDNKVDAICNSTANTSIMLGHLDEMLDIYKYLCEKSSKPEDLRRYRVLHARYISDKEQTTEEIAELEDIDTRTVFKDLKIACEKLTSLLFGVDHLS